MGKRSRKRTGPRGPVARCGSGEAARPEAPARDVPAYVAPRDRRSRKLEAPKAPWAPVPLTELAILVGMVLILVGFALGADRAGRLLIAGFALVSLAGLELALREHRAGYRSHSSLLAGATAVVLVAPLFFATQLAYEVLLVCMVVVFVAAFYGLRARFTRKTGLGFRA